MATVHKQLTWTTADWGHKSLGISIPLIFFLFSSISFYHALRPLSSLDRVRGLVSGSTIRRAGGRTKPLVVLFRLCSSATNFGILQGNNKSGAETLVARIQPDGSLTVYYDADGAESDGVKCQARFIFNISSIYLCRCKNGLCP